MAWGIVPGSNRKADLVVQLGRCWNVAFLLDVESHAGVGQMGWWPPYGASGLVTIARLA